MKKLFFLLMVSIFFLALFSFSSYVISAENEICCCESCDCSGDECQTGGCNMFMNVCPDLVECYDTFCTHCNADSDCEAIDSDGGIDIYTKGICHEFRCDEHKCEEKSMKKRDTGSYSYDYVDEKYPSTDPSTLNECEEERIYCPDGYEYSDGACVEIGVGEMEACNEQTQETSCISGYECCEECSKCYDTCPNELCCDSDDDCIDPDNPDSSNNPYCNLETNECQAGCPRSDYTTCESATEAETYDITCGTELTGCLYQRDKKYYKVTDSAGKEVIVTLKHSGHEYCYINSLFVYDERCNELGSSEVDDQDTDSWADVVEGAIIIEADGDCIDEDCEKCQWNLKVECRDVCDESPSKCSGPYSALETGAFGILDGCLYAHDSKFYKLLYSKDRKIEVRVTYRGGSECESKNDLLICDGCTNDHQCSEFARIENQREATWVGKLGKNVEIEIHSDSDNKNCLWSLEADYVSESCVDMCTAGDGTPCGKYRCTNGDCTTVCDTRCSEDNECGNDKPNNDGCDENWFCNADCNCVEGERKTKSLSKGWNMVSHSFKVFDTDTGDCNIKKVYAYTGGDIPYTRLGSLSDIEGGYAHWVLVENDCEVEFVGSELTTDIELEPGWNMIGTIKNQELSLNKIRQHCELLKVYRYVGGSPPYRRITDETEGKLYPMTGYWINVESGCTIRE